MESGITKMNSLKFKYISLLNNYCPFKHVHHNVFKRKILQELLYFAYHFNNKIPQSQKAYLHNSHLILIQCAIVCSYSLYTQVVCKHALTITVSIH